MSNYKTFHTCFILSKGFFPACTPGKVFLFKMKYAAYGFFVLCWSDLYRLISLNVLHGWSREQKNEQQNNAPNPKKQCSCRL